MEQHGTKLYYQFPLEVGHALKIYCMAVTRTHICPTETKRVCSVSIGESTAQNCSERLHLRKRLTVCDLKFNTCWQLTLGFYLTVTVAEFNWSVQFWLMASSKSSSKIPRISCTCIYTTISNLSVIQRFRCLFVT